MKYRYEKCDVSDCNKHLQHKGGRYCAMHLARIRRHGYLDLKKNPYQSLEKLPHEGVDEFILSNIDLVDKELADRLVKNG